MRFCLFSVFFVLLAAFAGAEERALVPEAHFAMFEKYCLECHDGSTEKGGVDLEDLSFDISTVESAERWQKVLNVMNSGEMPPEDEPQLTDGEKTVFLDDLSHQMVVARELLSDTGGVITMRRLNRREYENTVFDLLGVRVDAGELPDDSNSGGFDTTGASLFFSSDQFEQYLKLANRALDAAFVFGKKPKMVSMHHESEKDANKKIRRISAKLKKDYDQAQAWRATEGAKEPKDFGFLDESDVRFYERIHNQKYKTFEDYLNRPESQSGVLLSSFFDGATVDSIRIPNNWPAGEYILSVRTATLPGAQSHETFLEYGMIENGARTGELSLLGCRKVTGTLENPQTLKIPVEVTKDGGRVFGLRQRQHNNRDAVRQEFLRSLNQTGLGPPPALWIDSVSVEGPNIEKWPLRGVSKLFFDGMWWTHEDEDAYARKIISRFANRAFRIRKPSEAFLEKLYSLYLDNKASGMKFQEAIRDPLAVVMTSPGFLYLIEPIPGEQKRELTDEEFAVRLAYFLWSAPPDHELRVASRSGAFKKPATLAKVVERMLNDPRSDEFIASFTHQWLHMERLDFFQFDSLKYPEFDYSAKESARQEVFQTMRSILEENRPLFDLLKADYVVVNDVLADYYDLPPVAGSEFQKVSLPLDSPRGGLLGMAAIHAMGSDGNHTSVVERGAWVMRKLLHDPPPPAPANVPQLSRVQGKLLTPRMQLDAHMEEAQCAQCHRKIDPIGHGLENFDAAGKWRDELLLTKVVRKKVRQKKKVTVDASGQLPDGSKYDDYFGLRDQVAKKQDAFSRSFAESLISYALGRPYGFSDESLRERMIKRANAKDGEMREFIVALIQSKAFRTKK
ncbi:MAG: DUF1592 domain-containing protein [Verrucomicrobiales bacterium]|nr:DUF1592 domain-containing protein [Verrucomicrobiales bacterium]